MVDIEKVGYQVISNGSESGCRGSNFNSPAMGFTLAAEYAREYGGELREVPGAVFIKQPDRTVFDVNNNVLASDSNDWVNKRLSRKQIQ